MKKTALFFIALLILSIASKGNDLVILTTNDTHSNIDTDINGIGGILPRKAIIDSVRKAEKNVLLIDAGDMVQGSLYFKFFKGEVEYPIFNMMGYDIRILGNHEFDNGLEELSKYWKDVKSSRLSSNYEFTGTSAEGLFEPYVIKKIGKKRIGFIGINVNPASLIATPNYKGIKYKDPIIVANETAEHLKNNEECDLIIAITHIGYNEKGKPSDVKLAEQSKNIDIIIGGHSHTTVEDNNPETPSLIKNKSGKQVLVTQTGKNGRNLGYIKIDLDDLDEADFEYRLIPVTDRFDKKKYDIRLQKFLQPYRIAVDSINSIVIGMNMEDMQNGRRTGAFPNWTADMAMDLAIQISDSIQRTNPTFPNIDLAIMNSGGIRQPMAAGEITKGNILSIFPFSNHLNIIEIKGKDITDALKIAAAKGGEPISRNVKVYTDSERNLQNISINGLPIDPQKTYTVATLDYLAQGNDDLIPLSNSKVIWESDGELSDMIIPYIFRLYKAGIPIAPDKTIRYITI